MSWEHFLSQQESEPYFQDLMYNIEYEEEHKIIIYPPTNMRYKAFRETPFEKVKVVIIGQDPYHTPDTANGLAFSVRDGQPKPPSLVNIFKEIQRDLQICTLISGDLTRWAQQGVLLLNSTLTVRKGEPNSHKDFGWSELTDRAIKLLNSDNSPKVFLLWGKFAQQKAQFVTNSLHLVLQTSHPSPLGVRYGFEGCSHFSKTNSFLIEHNLKPIDWR